MHPNVEQRLNPGFMRVGERFVTHWGDTQRVVEMRFGRTENGHPTGYCEVLLYSETYKETVGWRRDYGCDREKVTMLEPASQNGQQNAG